MGSALVGSGSPVKFNQIRVPDDALNVDSAGRWMANGMQRTMDYIYPYTLWSSLCNPILLRSVHMDRFEATFSIKRALSGDQAVYFAFGAKDQNNYKRLLLRHYTTPTAPSAGEMVDGKKLNGVSGTGNAANVPALVQNDTLWVRVANDGTDLTVKCLKDNVDAPTEGEWGSAGVCYTTAISNFTNYAGGRIGVVYGNVRVDDLTVKSDGNADGDFADGEDLVEHWDGFEINGSNDAEETPVHDASGNLTYDGVYHFTYDAWNRLVRVKRAYRDSGGTLQTGSTVGILTYDPLGRKIIKDVANSGDQDATYHYFYDGQSMIETRNGSDQVLTQHVWGVGYIDELVQVSHNDDPADAGEDVCETPYYVLVNANYNVIGIVDAGGDLVERCEYTPYGQRTVFTSAGSNDPLVSAPILESQRWQVGGVDQPYGLCDIGHQGLLHDKEFGLIYNRARYLSPKLGRFTARDPLGYVDGMNAREYANNSPINRVDPKGTSSYSVYSVWHGPVSKFESGILAWINQAAYFWPDKVFMHGGYTFDLTVTPTMVKPSGAGTEILWDPNERVLTDKDKWPKLEGVHFWGNGRNDFEWSFFDVNSSGAVVDMNVRKTCGGKCGIIVRVDSTIGSGSLSVTKPAVMGKIGAKGDSASGEIVFPLTNTEATFSGGINLKWSTKIRICPDGSGGITTEVLEQRPHNPLLWQRNGRWLIYVGLYTEFNPAPEAN